MSSPPAVITDSIIGTTSWNFYLQDDIRLTPNLTINAGLRYEYNSPPVEQEDRFSIPDLSPASATCNPQPDCQFLVAGTNGISRATFRADRNNFAPRFGFAWRPYGSRNYVIRGGYGIFYDIAILNRSVAARINPPFFRLGILLIGVTDTIGTIANQPAFLQPAQTGLTDASGKDAYFQHWNLNVQRQLGTGLVIDAAVVGSKGTGLFRVVDPNQPLPNGGPRPYPQFGTVRMIAGAASSIYHAFQLRATQQYARGMTYLAAYTWSKAIDNASGMFGTTVGESDLPQDSRNLDGERGLSNFHAAHCLVVSYLQRVPSRILGDWESGLIWTAQTGRPFTVNREVDQSGTGAGVQTRQTGRTSSPIRFYPGHRGSPDPACRRTTAEGGRAAVTVRTPGSWFNPCAFAAPSTPRFGTVGRNTLIGPGFYNLDFSIKKEIAIVPEKQTLQLRVEFFNLFNHPNFDLPNRIFDSLSFSRVQSADAYGNKPPRQIQLGIRYIF